MSNKIDFRAKNGNFVYNLIVMMFQLNVKKVLYLKSNNAV